MTERPEDIQKRLAGLDDIGQVVGALRAIAAGHVGEARTATKAVATYAQTVEDALSLLTAEDRSPLGQGPGLLLIVGTAQGFSGSLSARIAEAARLAMRDEPGLIVVGNRTLEMLRAEGTDVLWSSDLPGHPASVAELASSVTDALVRHAVDNPGPIRAVIAPLHAGVPPEVRKLFPPPPLPEGTAPRGTRPITTMTAADLITGLLQEALFAAVIRALLEGAAAEAQARVEAMARAQSNLRSRREDVERQYQQARQEGMTTEMIELAVSRL